jgi:hypothetical protein
MTVTGQNFTCYRGQDLVITNTITGQNITGWTLAATFRNRTSGVSLTVDGTVTNGAGGVCTVTLTDEQTGAFATGQYDWSLWRTDAGSENPLSVGTMTVVSTSRE